jgi:hypothetical protein
MTTPLFQRAQRTQAKLNALLMGPSGAGKTVGALALATHIQPGKIALIDSEHGRSTYYADQYAFDVLALERMQPRDYIAALDAAVAAGYGLVVIDGLSHAWQDTLDRKEAYDRANPTSNSYTNWKLFGREWDELVRRLLETPVHLIATARSKQAYELVADDKGKKRPLKLGLQPTIREGTEYEFALVFDLLPSHRARATKDNLGIFSDEEVLWDLCDAKVGEGIARWLSAGAPAPARLPKAPAPASAPAPAKPPVKQGNRMLAEAEALAEITRDSVFPLGKFKGTALRELPAEFLVWATEEPRNLGPRSDDWRTAMEGELEQRTAEAEEADLEAASLEREAATP